METKNLQWLLIGGLIGYVAYSMMKKNEDMSAISPALGAPETAPPTDMLGGLPAPAMPPMPIDPIPSEVPIDVANQPLPDTGTTPVTVTTGTTPTGTTITTTGTGTTPSTTSFVGTNKIWT